MKSIRSVACLLNGSVDSAVAALLLKRTGYQVIGVCVNRLPWTQQQTHHDEPTVRDVAQAVCQKLDIPLLETSIPQYHRQKLIRNILEDYQQGFQPDVPVLYNKHIVFDGLLGQTQKELQVDAFATSHFARTSPDTPPFHAFSVPGTRLLKSVDQQCDQTSQLCQISQKSLQNTLFPLGEFNRDVILKIAEIGELDKIIYTSKDEENLKEVEENIKKQVPPEQGVFVDVESDLVQGQHEGIHHYKVGNTVDIRDEKYYIVESDIAMQKVFLAKGTDHPALHCERLFASLVHWIHHVPFGFYETQMMDFDFCFTGERPLQKCTLTVGLSNPWCGNDHVVLSSPRTLWGVSPGQYVTFYRGEECMGSSKVIRAGPSQYIMNYRTLGKPKVQPQSRFSLKRLLEHFKPSS